MIVLQIKENNIITRTVEFSSQQEASEYVITNSITEFSIIDIIAQKESEEASQYLKDTDWYIIREMDSGTPCPQEIKTARAAARLKVI